MQGTFGAKPADWQKNWYLGILLWMMSLSIADIGRIFRLRCWMNWIRKIWLTWAYTCKPLYVEWKMKTHNYNEHRYHRHLSFRKSGNNVLLFFTWNSMTHDRLLEIIIDWANSPNNLNLYQRLLRDFLHCQEPKQLILILAALLCFQRLFPYISKDTMLPANGSYLADMSVLLSDRTLCNQRTIIEKMCFSILRVFQTLPDDYKDMSNLFLPAINTCEVPLLETLDALTDQYLAQRIMNGHHHLMTNAKMMDSFSAASLKLEFSGEISSALASIDSNSKGCWIVIDANETQ